MKFKFVFPKIGYSYELNVESQPCSKNLGLNCHLFTFIAFKVKMFGPFWSVQCKMALTEVGHDDAMPLSV